MTPELAWIAVLIIQTLVISYLAFDVWRTLRP